MKKLWAILVGLFSIGILLIPDAIPLIDEAGAALLLIWAIKRIFGRGSDAPSSVKKPPEKTVN